ncbi:hypothetical protein [Mycolicibacterium sp. D5.8-2]|uniref:hypothetical protein n=1 Tax=Mycolicibacterium sp. D5.8-2 TaxID=3085903 RepID=UPI00298CC20C|nr:hypothetical protein [Mycolicibacterium sp. D5.8-2]MDW5609731.1 hypothetical protein [Mycolicibacterium sp. D5.8-2]
MVTLQGEAIEAALYAVSALMTYRQKENRPIPGEVVSLHRRLLNASVAGSECDGGGEQLTHDLVDTAVAADIIGCSRRWVWSIRNDLDGRKLGRQWFFPHGVVVEYADAKQSA